MVDPGHPQKLLAATVKLRAVLKKKVHAAAGGLCWVMDTCSCVPDPDQSSMTDMLLALKPLCAEDGVHLKPAGYTNLGRNIVATVIKLQNGMIGKYDSRTSVSAASSVTGPANHFWRGFCSPVGSKGPCQTPNWAKAKRDWSYRPKGPYEGKGNSRGPR